MYTKKFIPLLPEDINKVNASALAHQFECTYSYVSRVLKSKELPKNEKAQKIIEAARRIIKMYQIQE